MSLKGTDRAGSIWDVGICPNIAYPTPLLALEKKRPEPIPSGRGTLPTVLEALCITAALETIEYQEKNRDTKVIREVA